MTFLVGPGGEYARPPTLVDVARGHQDSEDLPAMIELLNQSNGLLRDIPWEKTQLLDQFGRPIYKEWINAKRKP